MERMQESKSVVEVCGVETCAYNKARQCTAGAITINMVDGMAHCITFVSKDGATGIGSTSVNERSRAHHDDHSA